MGSGKGNPEHWVAVVKPGRILFELSYTDPEIARAAIDRAIQKLPIKARFVAREEALLMAKTDRALRDLGDAELLDRLAEAKEELFNLRFQHVTGQLDNTARLGSRASKDVARINTELREREIAAAEALAAERGDRLMADETRPTDDDPRQPPQGPRGPRRLQRDGQDGRRRRHRPRAPPAATTRRVQRTTKLYVHDEANDLNVGDRVRVQETRPLSKLKRWRLVEVLERAR